MTNDKPFPFADWWTAVLARDDEWLDRARRDEDLDERNPLLDCVFCRQPIEPTTPGNAMLAWWEHREYIVEASGLYHTGQHKGGRCLDLAEQAGYLRDIHAETAIGKAAWLHMNRIVRDYEKWDGRALRRLVMIFGELSAMKMRRGLPEKP